MIDAIYIIVLHCVEDNSSVDNGTLDNSAEKISKKRKRDDLGMMVLPPQGGFLVYTLLPLSYLT